MVDLVTEIPLPGRTFRRASDDGSAAAECVAVPAFVAGPENRLLGCAVNRVLPAAESSNERDAPAAATPSILVIFGPTGTGKTHVARGVVRSWQEAYGAESAEYIVAADFRYELNDAIKNSTVDEFRRRFRSRPLLAIDDVDQLPPDGYLQHELRATIDGCEGNGVTLVVTSSHAVSGLRGLSADVRSRLAAGLELRLALPEEAARRRIIRHASSALGSPLSDEAGNRLAAAVSGTAADLFGALFEMYADRAGRRGGDEPWVERFLAARAARRPLLRDILPVVAKYYSVPQRVLKSGSRRQSAAFARAMAVYLARELAGLSYERIGRALGGRDHTTMMYSYRKIGEQVKYDPTARQAADDLRRILGHA